jgi:hypothetical protein
VKAKGRNGHLRSISTLNSLLMLIVTAIARTFQTDCVCPNLFA